MSFIMFILASMFEYTSFFIFVMVLFRFTIREHIAKFILGSLILAFVSNTIQTESLQDISPLINVVILFFLITIILRTRLFHSFVMLVIGYVAQALVQWLLVSVLIHYKVFNQINSYTRNGYIVQVLTFLIMCLISAFIYATKGGFSYIQSNNRFYKDSLKGNRLFITFLVLGLLVLFFANFLYMTSSNLPDYLYSIAIATIIILIILIYFSIRKDV